VVLAASAAVCWLAPGRAGAQEPPAAAVRAAAPSAEATQLSLATLLARARAGQVLSL
jgi:hypothetical protein